MVLYRPVPNPITLVTLLCYGILQSCIHFVTGQAKLTITERLDPGVDKTIERTVWQPGDPDIELSCTIEGNFDGAAHISNWRKSQPRLHKNGLWELQPHEYRISQATVIEDPSVFKNAGRFRVVYSRTGNPSYTLVIESESTMTKMHHK